MRVKIEDVARGAGVSATTVSRVFNQEASVTAETRARVEAVARALNYRPHPSARRLASNRSFLIVLVFDQSLTSPPYILELMLGVLEKCKSLNYQALLQPLEIAKTDPVLAIRDIAHEHRPDAFVFVPPTVDSPKVLRQIHELGIRYAAVAASSRQAHLNICFDERKAAGDLIGHLVALGHRRIAHVLGGAGHAARDWRFDGYRSALRKAGISLDESLVVEGDFGFASGTDGAQKLLALKRPPTAIFAASDDCAYGVIHEALKQGLSIPQDLSVCGFDDFPNAHMFWPNLTTVHQPCREMGQVAVEQALLQSPDSAAKRIVNIPYEIKLRQSTGPVSANKNAAVGKSTA